MCRSVLLGLFVLFYVTGCGGGGGGGGGQAQAPTPAGTDTSAQPTTSNQPAPPPIAAGPSTTTTINVLALYSSGVAAQFADPDLRIQHLVNVANDVLNFSGVALTLNAAHTEWVDYADTPSATTALDDMTHARVVAFADLDQLRDQHAADVVVLFRPYANDGYCGYAWLGGFATQGDLSAPAHAEFAYAVVAANCSDYILLHELGHTLGLAHSLREDQSGGTFISSVGYGVDNDFATIMAAPGEYNATQVPRLSSPLLDCNGSPCGIGHGSVNAADAVHTLNTTKDQVAAYRE